MPAITASTTFKITGACRLHQHRSATLQQQQEQGASSPCCPRLLPVLAWHEILCHLDQLSRAQLKLADTLFCSLINATMTQLSLSACDLKSADLEALAGRRESLCSRGKVKVTNRGCYCACPT